jgi:RND family efflux transporter MFP subunit
MHWIKRAIIFGIVLAVTFFGYLMYRNAQTPATVPTDTAKRGSVTETVSLTGELIPEQYADLAFQSVGVVDGVYVSQGDTVKTGQPIASLDRTVLQASLNEERVALAIARKNAALAERRHDLYKKEERDVKQLEINQAEKRVASLVAQIAENTIVAPLDGIISKLDIRTGETSVVSAAIARVVGNTTLLIEARVPESDIANIRIGMKASVTFDALSPSDVFEGEVDSIDPAATTVQDVVSYKVRFRLTKQDERLREGMTSDIDVVTAQADDVVVVPFRAIIKESGKTYVKLKRLDGSFDRIPVAIGIEGDEGTVEILSGLSAGDEVAIGASQK